MREKSLLQLFLVLNVALAGAFVVYLYLSSNHQPKVVATGFSQITAARQTNPPVPQAGTNSRTAVAASQAVAASINAPTTTPVGQATPLARPAPLTKKFTWQDVESDQYQSYMENLRLSGCPEEKIRYIVLSDVNELFAQRRLKDAVAQDVPWWRVEASYRMALAAGLAPEEDRQQDEQRRALISKLLGPAAADSEKGETTAGGVAKLTGPVLGKLEPERLNTVQEICKNSYDRRQNAVAESANAGKLLNPVEEARMREQTRVELRRVLNPQEMEEFLLRNSHNVFALREELRGLEPTPDEFRKVFRAIDPIDHAMQLEFGGPEAMSEKQRERWQHQRQAAIKEVLTPERYRAYLRMQDPLYRQAQLYAQQYGAPARAVQPLYDMSKAIENQRRQITNNAGLNPQQKAAELQRLNVEQQRNIQRIITEINAAR